MVRSSADCCLEKALPERTFEGALNVRWTLEEQPTEAERRAAKEVLYRYSSG